MWQTWLPHRWQEKWTTKHCAHCSNHDLSLAITCITNVLAPVEFFLEGKAKSWVLGKVNCLDVVYTIFQSFGIEFARHWPTSHCSVVWLSLQPFNGKSELIHCHVSLDPGFLALVSSLKLPNLDNHGKDGLVACGVAMVGDGAPFRVVHHVVWCGFLLAFDAFSSVTFGELIEGRLWVTTHQIID